MKQIIHTVERERDNKWYERHWNEFNRHTIYEQWKLVIKTYLAHVDFVHPKMCAYRSIECERHLFGALVSAWTQWKWGWVLVDFLNCLSQVLEHLDPILWLGFFVGRLTIQCDRNRKKEQKKWDLISTSHVLLSFQATGPKPNNKWFAIIAANILTARDL